jgi:Icc-related predicted phosphoesterase
MIQYMGDVSTRISLDQIARKYILQIESTGKLTDEMANNIENDVKGLSIVDENKEVVVKVYGENNKELVRDVSASYGSTVRLEITCNVNKTTFVPTGTFGNWNRKTSVPITITKQSTAKY